MSLLVRFLRGIGRFLRGVLLFFGLCLVWTGLLYVLQFWSDAGMDPWPGAYPVAVTHVATGTTEVIPFRALPEARKADPSLVPWPVTPSGSTQEGRVHTAWSTVQGERWQFEVRWEDRDYLLESRSTATSRYWWPPAGADRRWRFRPSFLRLQRSCWSRCGGWCSGGVIGAEIPSHDAVRQDALR